VSRVALVESGLGGWHASGGLEFIVDLGRGLPDAEPGPEVVGAAPMTCFWLSEECGRWQLVVHSR